MRLRWINYRVWHGPLSGQWCAQGELLDLTQRDTPTSLITHPRIQAWSFWRTRAINKLERKARRALRRGYV